jgi:hypothetical protein
MRPWLREDQKDWAHHGFRVKSTMSPDHSEIGGDEPNWASLIRLMEVLGVGLVALGFEGLTLPDPPTVPVSKKRHRPRKPR